MKYPYVVLKLIFYLPLIFFTCIGLWKAHRETGPLEKKLLLAKDGQEFSEIQRILFQKKKLCSRALK